MRLVSAGALWWLLLSAPIIFFYLLKLKRKRRVVPSVFLWQRAMEELEANAPFRRLRRNLLLLLQLLALTALVFALARPLVSTRAVATGSTIILIDSTASMAARDEEGGSRLNRAKEIAREVVAGLGEGDRAAIIESSSRVTVRAPLTSDRAALHSIISDITETDAAGTLADGLRLAEQIARAESDAALVVITDGAGAGLDPSAHSNFQAPASSREVPINLVRVGMRADNVAIIAMNARPSQGGRRELFASVANFGDSGRSISAELRIDGKLVDVRTLNVEANGRSALIFDSLPGQAGLAELRLNAGDDLAADNVAYAALPDARRIRVGVIGDNPFLIEALAVNTDLDALKVAGGAQGQGIDCIVAEGALPDELIGSDLPVLAINPPDAAGLWRATGERERPGITSVDRAHPVNSYLNYSDLHIERLTRRDVAPSLRPIVASEGDALIYAGEDKGRRLVMVGFDLAKSDLPLKVEFPILLANAISWLAGRDALASDRSVRAGQPVALGVTRGSATVTTPSGDAREVASGDGMAIFADTLRVGLYAVDGGPPFAVSLLSEAESDTAPRDSITTSAGEVMGRAETFHSEREAWRWVALAALAVLAIEWLVYHRRMTG